jgi:hypothetical protein
MPYHAFRLLFLALLPAQLFAQTRWHELPEQGFKIQVPTSYQSNTFTEGTDHIHAFVSPDQNVGVRIRTIPLDGRVELDVVAQLFERNVLSGSERLVLTDYELNGISGKMAGYRWTFNGIPVGIGAFYAIRDRQAYVVWSIIPISLFRQRNAEADAIVNTFTLLQPAGAGGGLGGLLGGSAPADPAPKRPRSGSIGGTVSGASRDGGSPTPPTPPAGSAPTGTAPHAPSGTVPPPARTAPLVQASPQAGYQLLVEETAGISFAYPSSFTVYQRSEGESRWEGAEGTGDAEIKMIIQTVHRDGDGYADAAAAYRTMHAQVAGNANAAMGQRRDLNVGGLSGVAFDFTLRQGDGTLQFSYVLVERPAHITFISFLGPSRLASRIGAHASEVARTLWTSD